MTDNRFQDTDPTSNEDQWAMRVQDIAGRFDYPPTPDIAGAVRARIARAHRWPTNRAIRLAQAAAVILLVIIIVTLAVPDLRARAFDLLGIGAVRFVDEPTLTPGENATARPLATLAAADPLFDPAHAVTLDEARSRVDFPIRVPSALGVPDQVFLHDQRVPLVILIWTDPADPTEPPVSLHIIGPGILAFKYNTEQRIETRVNGRPAAWLVEPHLFTLQPGDLDMVERVVNVNVLIWEEGDLTYRLEGVATRAEAVRIAESLR
jgi:hypothetical protein